MTSFDISRSPLSTMTSCTSSISTLLASESSSRVEIDSLFFYDDFGGEERRAREAVCALDDALEVFGRCTRVSS